MAEAIATKAQAYLSEHKEVPAIYATSDGYLFTDRRHALTHGATLKDTKVQEIRRSSGDRVAPKRRPALSVSQADASTPDTTGSQGGEGATAQGEGGVKPESDQGDRGKKPSPKSKKKI